MLFPDEAMQCDSGSHMACLVRHLTGPPIGKLGFPDW